MSKSADPMVYAVMVTGKTPARIPLAQRSIQSWLFQSYPYRQLLIINDGPQSLFSSASVPPGITELRIDGRRALGELRNIAIDFVQRDPQHQPDIPRKAIIQWDDDDFSHPMRISEQVASWEPGAAVILYYEAHCNLHTGQSFVSCGRQQRSGGFSGTILHDAFTSRRYDPKATKEEDAVFAKLWKRAKKLRVIKANPLLYVRFYHGQNTWPEDHVMHRGPGSRELTPEELEMVHGIRKSYAGIV